MRNQKSNCTSSYCGINNWLHSEAFTGIFSWPQRQISNTQSRKYETYKELDRILDEFG